MVPYAVPGPEEEWMLQILDVLPSTPLYYVPGEMYHYSGVGMGLLAMALVRATGYSYADIAQDLLFSPLGMVHSGIELTPAMEDLLAVGRMGARRRPVSPMNLPGVSTRNDTPISSAGVYSSVQDLVFLLSGLAGSSHYPILTTAGSSGILELAGRESNSVAESGITASFAGSSSRIEIRGGTTSGHTAYAVFDLDSGVGLILLKSYAGGDHLEQAAKTTLDELLDAISTVGGRLGGDVGTGYRSDAVEFSEVDRRPVRTTCAQLVYPPTLRQAQNSPIQHPVNVHVEFVIGTDGLIEQGRVAVIGSSDRRFNDAAVAWAGSCTYSPGYERGRPVRVIARQVVTFQEPR